MGSYVIFREDGGVELTRIPDGDDPKVVFGGSDCREVKPSQYMQILAAFASPDRSGIADAVRAVMEED